MEGCIDPHSCQAPVTNLEHPAHRLFHVEPASPCAQLDAPEREHVIAEVSHVIEPKVEALEALLYIREPLAHSVVPSVWLASKAPKARKQLDVRCGGIEEEVVVALVPAGESVAHQLHVLLRHRLLPQPGGLEGLLP